MELLEFLECFQQLTSGSLVLMSVLKFMQILASFSALGTGIDTPGPEDGLISMMLGHWVEPL